METGHETQDFDYSHVYATARVALYDDLKSAPRVTDVAPADTNEFIEKLTTTIYEQVKLVGGKIPYTLIREVSENFIHAQFKEIVVSILDDGNTIRFADQGPGIQEKQKAQEPGFTSATEPMKKYIRGVGSGFPLVRDYLENSDGTIVIEDNLVSGAVVTISLERKKAEEIALPAHETQAPHQVNPVYVPPIPLSEREKDFLGIILREGEVGVTELSKLTGTPNATTYNTLLSLEESSLVQKSPNKKRHLTEIGYQVALTL